MDSKTDQSFTLTEILVALMIATVAVSVISYLLLSGVARSHIAACGSNLRQINLALSMYAADYDTSFPPVVATRFINNQTQSGSTWRDLITVYLRGQAFPRCPEAELNPSQDRYGRSIDDCGYALNQRLNQRQGNPHQHSYVGKADNALPYPALTITVFDARTGILALRGPDVATRKDELHGVWRTDMVQAILSQRAGALRHNGGANYGFADGHISWLRPEHIRSRAPNGAITQNTQQFF